MSAPKRGARLGSGPAHQSLMLSNLASDLFRHGQIRTTVTKAKTLRPYAEKLITKAKRGDLHARRQVLSTLRDRDVVAYLFEEVAPRFADRNGGYTRILKLGPRPGDNAPMAIIELVDRGAGSGDDQILEGKEKRSRGIFGRRRFRRAAEGVAVADDFDFDDEEVEVERVDAPAADAPAADEAADDAANEVDAPGEAGEAVAEDEAPDVDAESADAEAVAADTATDTDEEE